MAYVKKISDSQFYLDIINKELEIAGGPQFDTSEDLKLFTKLNREWFLMWVFSSKEQFLEFKKYYYDHFYDWKPKSYNKHEMYRYFNGFIFNYGLKFNFEFKYHELYDD